MKIKLTIKSDELDKDDLRALLQAIRTIEQTAFKEKKIYVSCEAPDMPTKDMAEVLSKIDPPYDYGPVIFKYLKYSEDDLAFVEFQEENCRGCFYADAPLVGSGKPCCTKPTQIEVIAGKCKSRREAK